MNLHEYQTKKIFKNYNLCIPEGYVCKTIKDAKKNIIKLKNNYPLVLKCQIHAGGRGKAFGIKQAKNFQDIEFFFNQWLNKRLVTYQTNSIGQIVNKILIEKSVKIEQEFYIGVILDFSSNKIFFLASREGGINIEKTAHGKPNTIYKITIDPLIGPMPYQGRQCAFNLGLKGKLIEDFTNIFIKIIIIFLKYDTSLIEINPLVLTNKKKFVCLDAKMSIDDNAIYRQPELAIKRDWSQEDKREMQAMKHQLNYISLNGSIGCMVNGAGLAMATMDLIKLYGGSPANFLDVGGDTNKERVQEAFKIILSDSKVKVILINIFGGIVRCDLIADGIISAMKEIRVDIPVVVRLEGNNAKLGIEKLKTSQLKIIAAINLVDAVQKVIFISEKY
ncbi:MAG: ADP-forming succinate--CoA ligase subunit beta [Arsenophonus sp.]|nr:MAG: ADP-forming succinate--CoA ligase subunit beta [Arsenophonus sp.]